MADTILILKAQMELTSQITSNKNNPIFTLDHESHKTLKQKSIPHHLADVDFNEDELREVFHNVISMYNWYDVIPNDNKLSIKTINFFGILDTAELHSFLINNLYDFLMIKNIIEKLLPKKIIISESLQDLITPFLNNFKFEIISSNKSENIVYDKYKIKFNLLNHPLSFNISRQNYLKIKKYFEQIISYLYNLNPKPNNIPSILFLEINPSDYEELFYEFSKKDIQILILNNRRPAIWNNDSLKIIRKYGVKIVRIDSLLTKEDHNEINILTCQLREKIHSLKNLPELKSKFQFNNISYWDCIENKLIQLFYDRCSWYLLLIFGVEKLLKTYNIENIISFNVVGETEKIVLDLNDCKIQSIMLEHGFANYSANSSFYDILSMYSLFNDKIAVWGDIQKDYLRKFHQIDENRILVTGSPRHDKFFQDESLEYHDRKIILITPRPIIDTAIHKKISSYEKYEEILTRVIVHLKKFTKYNVVIKLHPSLDNHSNEITKIINKIDSNIPIYQYFQIKDLMKKAYANITISPEGFDPSTVLMESMILKTPALNIILDEEIYDYEYNKMHALLNCINMQELENYIDKIISDVEIRNNLITNSQKFLQKYLRNQGYASKYLSTLLYPKSNINL